MHGREYRLAIRHKVWLDVGGRFAVGDGGSFVVFAADFAGIEFVAGTTLTLIVTFSDGTTVSATTVARRL